MNQTTPKLTNKKKASSIFKKLDKFWPNAHCELVHNTPFQLLLCVLLSAQTTDKAVNLAMNKIYLKNPSFSPYDLIAMGEKKFLSAIKTIGLAPTKTKNSMNMAKKLIEIYNGEVPKLRNQLEELPGVGRKTASVVLGELFGEPTFAVDTHVARLAVRLGFCPPELNRNKIEEELLLAFEKKYLPKAHHLFIFHGRYHCTARSPKCENCPILKECSQVGV
jgi:endonuclease III